METLCSRTDTSQESAACESDDLSVQDGLLLERFLRERDETAFAELVRRHGPMVLGACRRVLDNPHDAEDCFQAVFMVLVKKGQTIRPSSMVGNWLYGVAYRTALEARKLAARRRVIEKKKCVESPGTAGPGPWQELRPELDRELSRLPDQYRSILVACDLEGKTRREAAAQFGLPEGTVASRLARARRILAKRMARYASVSPGALGMLLTAHGTEPVPPALIAVTARTATELAAGKPSEGTLAPYVAALCDAVVKSMLWTKVQVGAAAFAALVVIAFGILTVVPAIQGQKDAAALAFAKAEKAKPRKYERDCVVTKVDVDNRKLSVNHAGPDGKVAAYEYIVPAGTNIIVDGKEVKLADLRAGLTVQLEIDADGGGSCRARKIEALGEQVRGVAPAVHVDANITAGPRK